MRLYHALRSLPSSQLTLNRYVQILEHQQIQLTAGVQELYQRQRNGWDSSGRQLEELQYEKPPTHEILKSLGILDSIERNDFHFSESKYEDSEVYPSGVNSFMKTKTPPAAQSITPATQIPSPGSSPRTDSKYDHQDNLHATFDSAFSKVPDQSQPELFTLNSYCLHIDDEYLPGFDMHSTAEIDNPFSWPASVIHTTHKPLYKGIH